MSFWRGGGVAWAWEVDRIALALARALVIKEVPVEVIKEVAVPQFIEKEIIREVPVERIVEKEVIKEVPIIKYITVDGRHVDEGPNGALILKQSLDMMALMPPPHMMPPWMMPPGPQQPNQPNMPNPLQPGHQHGCCTCGGEKRIEIVEKEIIKEVKVDVIKEVAKEVVKYIEVRSARLQRAHHAPSMRGRPRHGWLTPGQRERPLPARRDRWRCRSR